MTPFVFDTLSASKQLREAGMAEGVAEAVVSVFQHAAAMPDISHLATKDQVDALSADVANTPTRAEVEAISSEMKSQFKAIRQEMATKEDIAQVKLEIANLRASVNETIRHQGWMLLGGVGVLVTILNGLMKMFG